MIKHKIRSYLSVLLILSVVVACAVLLSSCGNDVNQIYVDNSHSPRLTYVQGQELDLTKGILTAVVGKDGEETLIPMTDEGVSVTGYDKNTLGSQNLIVTYAGKTTTITVNVIPRISAEGYETGYFTGDAFKTNKGKLKVAKDDATTVLISMDDPRVTLLSFDSTSAGEKTVTVKYTDSGSSYECSFNVLVYDAATSEISIVFPKKNNYGSHETVLDYTGGYITVKGGADGKLEKHIDIVDDMTKGYDPSVVTAANPTATQTITIEYLGKIFEYNVTVTYSGISKILNEMSVLNAIDLSDANKTLTDAEKLSAWTAISEYYALRTNERKNISEDDLNTILRVAAIAVSDLYREELKNYDQTIIISNESAQIIAKTYESTVEDLKKLNDPKELLNRYASVLRSMIEEHSDLVVKNEQKLSELVFVIPKDFENQIIAILTHLTELHSTMSDIPADWTEETLKKFEPQLYRIKVDIQNAGYYRNGQGNFYQILSSWREKGDFFEIVYTYYLYCNESYGPQAIVDAFLDTIPWPEKINTWYTYWYMLTSMSKNYKDTIASNANKAFMTDVTPYIYYYKLLTEGRNEILQNKDTDKLTYDLYGIIAGDMRMQTIRYETYGLLKLQGFMADETDFGQMWDTYLELVDLYATGKLVAEDGKVITEGFEDKYEAVMNGLFELSPTELHEFLSSLNLLYGKTDSDVLALKVFTTESNGETVTTYLSTLSLLMNAYYKTTLNENEFAVFENLLVAIENYARIGKVTGAKDAFMEAMAKVEAALANDSFLASFDAKIGDSYKTYLKLYNACKNAENIIVGSDVEKLISSFISYAAKIEVIRDYILAETQKPEEERAIKNEAYMILFALYENARWSYLSLSDMAAKDDDIRLALYKNLYDFGEEKLTVEQIFEKIGNYYWGYIIRLPGVTVSNGSSTYTYNLYDIYISQDLLDFLFKAADFLYADFNNSSLDSFTEADLESMISAYNKITDLILIGTLDLYNIDDLYFSVIDKYIDSKIPADTETCNLSDKLIAAARAHATLRKQSSEENVKAFKAAMETVNSLKNQLASDENFQKYLKVMYDYYQSQLDALNNPEA